VSGCQGSAAGGVAEFQDVIVSEDAGRYLCEFIYARSMEEGARSGIPVLFCHVPCEGYPFSLREMTEIIKKLVSCMIEMNEMSEKSLSRRGRTDDSA
jgi:hypothetical protein